MSNEENKPVLYPKNGEVNFTMPNTNVLGKLKDANEGRSLTAKYMTAQEWEEIKGKPLLCFFIGFKDALDSQGNVYLLAKLIDQNNKPFVAAQTILCQSLSATAPGQGVKITCTGIEKAAQGKMVSFEVVELDVNIFSNHGAE